MNDSWFVIEATLDTAMEDDSLPVVSLSLKPSKEPCFRPDGSLAIPEVNGFAVTPEGNRAFPLAHGDVVGLCNAPFSFRIFYPEESRRYSQTAEEIEDARRESAKKAWPLLQEEPPTLNESL